jgi:hypothetical protein
VIIFRTLEKIIPNETDWYDGGYRANVVTYSIAKLVQMINEQAKGRAINFQMIWRQQAISPALTEQLKIIARVMYSVITTPEQGSANITEWCKIELAWQRAQARHIDILPSFAEELVSSDLIEEIKKDAVDLARIDRGIASITTVMQRKPALWRQIRQWGMDHRNLTAKEEQLLLLAATPGKVPSEKQAVAILLILRKLQQEGLDVDYK